MSIARRQTHYLLRPPRQRGTQPAVVVPFQRPADLLICVEHERRYLDLPDWDTVTRVYDRQYRTFQKVFRTAHCYERTTAAWQALASETGIPYSRLEFFRNKVLIEPYRQQMNAWERAAYSLGLYVARREFPRYRRQDEGE